MPMLSLSLVVTDSFPHHAANANQISQTDSSHNDAKPETTAPRAAYKKKEK